MRELKRPSRARFEFTVQGVTGVYVSDGTQGWQVSPFDGVMGPSPLPDDVVSEAAEQADIEGSLVDWQAKGHRVELVGRESVGGREAYKLKVTLKSGAVRHEYIDVKSMNLVRSDSTRKVRGHPVQMQTTPSGISRVGVCLPPPGRDHGGGPPAEAARPHGHGRGQPAPERPARFAMPAAVIAGLRRRTLGTRLPGFRFGNTEAPP